MNTKRRCSATTSPQKENTYALNAPGRTSVKVFTLVMQM